MTTEDDGQSNLLPHHEQQDLCTTRLPYRQGRKLTAVKVYSINNESKHLLIFGVPSLNLRQETKSLFMKFGKLLIFSLTKYPSEKFTETYHAVYESIQSARLAKKMLDTKNYYGGNLHICYAPELESVEETREKLLQRKTQVLSRLKNLEREAEITRQELENRVEERLNDFTLTRQDNNMKSDTVEKMYMGSVNKITFGKRRKEVKPKFNKKSKVIDMNLEKNIGSSNTESISTDMGLIETLNTSKMTDIAGPSYVDTPSSTVEVIEMTSANKEVISNINEALNYNNFGNEIIRKVPQRPVNRIKFNINKKS